MTSGGRRTTRAMQLAIALPIVAVLWPATLLVMVPLVLLMVLVGRRHRRTRMRRARASGYEVDLARRDAVWWAEHCPPQWRRDDT